MSTDTTNTPSDGSITVTLDQPIQRGQQKITSLTLRRPNTGALRGINLAELLQMRTDALVTLLPRISSPTLTKPEIESIDPADLVTIATEVGSFFVPRSQLAALLSPTE